MNKKLLLSFVFYVIVFFTLYDYSVSKNNCDKLLHDYEIGYSTDSLNQKIFEYERKIVGDSSISFATLECNILKGISNTEKSNYEWYTAAKNLRLKFWFYMSIYLCMIAIGLIDFFYEDKK